MKRHKIAVIPGDGIGNEVVPEGMRVLEAAGRRFGFECAFTTFDWNCERFTKTGRMMPEDGLDQLRAFEAIFLGGSAFPGVPDHVSLWGLLIPIRRGFHQYINLRPVRLLKGVRSPWRDELPPTSTCSSCGRTTKASIPRSAGGSTTAGRQRDGDPAGDLHPKGCDRVMRYAFERARRARAST